MERLTNKDFEKLMANTLKVAPNNPSGQGMSAETIKKLYYKGFEILFNWLKDTQDAFSDSIDFIEAFNQFKEDVKTRYFNVQLNANVSGDVITGLFNFGQIDLYINYEYDKEILITFSNYTLILPYVRKVDDITKIEGVATDNLSNVYYTIINLTSSTGALSGRLIKLATATQIESILTQLPTFAIKSDVNNELAKKVDKSQIGVNGGLATLDNSGKIPSTQLPSYVDDVLEFASRENFPATGEDGKIYVSENDNKTYRWSGSSYVEISSSLALGETSSTAYAGDKGKKNATDIASLTSVVNNQASELANKVDKETGKGLSTNDFTDAYKDKLDNIDKVEYVLPIASATQLGGIKIGAGFSMADDGTLSVSAGGTADSVNWSGVIGRPFNSVDSTYFTIDNAVLKINTNQIATKSSVDSLSSSKQDKLSQEQLNAINSGITATKVASYDNYATSKQDALNSDQMNAVNSGITQAKVNQYDNYETSKANANNVYTKQEVDEKFTASKQGRFQVVSELPSSGEEGIIYLVGSNKNNYTRYTWENDEWVPLGSTSVDLTGYVKGTNLTAEQIMLGNGTSNIKASGKTIETTLTNDANKIPTSSAIKVELDKKANSTHTHAISDITNLQTDLDTKVDKEDGKQLSTNDFTDTYKTKLDGLNNYTLPKATASVLGGVKVASVRTSVMTTEEGKTENVINYGVEMDSNGKLFVAVNKASEVEAPTEASQINYGDKTVAQVLDELLYTPISISGFSNNHSTNEKGQTITSLTFNWTLNKTPTSQKLNEETLSNSVRTHTLSSLSITNNTTYTLKVSDGKTEKTASTSVNFLNKAYWGVASASDNIDNAFVLGLSDSALTSSRARTITLNAGANQYIYYAFPTSFGTPKFTVGGFEGGFDLVKTFSFTNASGYSENYYVYKSARPNLGNTTVVIS